MEKVNLDRKKLKRFGITMGIAFFCLAAVMFFRKGFVVGPPLFISAAFFITGFALPIMLKPVYVIWLGLGSVLGWINTQVILFIVFYLVFTPIGLIVRLCGKDLLDIKIEREKKTYWSKREGENLQYERQF